MAGFAPYDLGNVLAKSEQIKGARFKNEGFERQNEMRNVLAQSGGKMTPEVMNQLNQIDPMQAQKIRQNQQTLKTNDLNFQMKGMKWLKLSAPMVNNQKSYTAWRNKAIANKTMNQDDMPSVYDENTKSQMKLMVGALDVKMNSPMGKLYQDRERLRRAGKLTPELNAQFNKKMNAKGGININVGGPPKVKPGFVAVKDATGRYYVKPVIGGVKKTREESATAQGVQYALRTIRDSIYGGTIINPSNKKKMKLTGILDEDGNVNEWIVAGMTMNIPYTDGRIHRNRFKDALQAKLRAETGAAAPDSEVKNLMQRFMPSSADSDTEVIDKLNRLKAFLNGFMARTDPELYRTLRTIQLKRKGITGAKADSAIRTEIEQGGMRGIGSKGRFDSSLDEEDSKKSNIVNRDSSKMTTAQKKAYLKKLRGVK